MNKEKRGIPLVLLIIIVLVVIVAIIVGVNFIVGNEQEPQEENKNEIAVHLIEENNYNRA